MTGFWPKTNHGQKPAGEFVFKGFSEKKCKLPKLIHANLGNEADNCGVTMDVLHLFPQKKKAEPARIFSASKEFYKPGGEHKMMRGKGPTM